jgi:hypothetical protein
MVVPGKQHIIGVDGIDDVDAYNNCNEMPLFTNFINKISVVEKNLPKDVLPWERKGVKGKVVTVGTNN